MNAAHLNEVRRKAGVKKFRRRRLPPQQWPKRLEQSYVEALTSLTSQLARWSMQSLMRQLPDILRDARQDSSDARRYFGGFEVVVENPAGSVRRWRDGDRIGATVMLHDYGFIAGFKGADGDEVDVYLGPDERSEWVTVIHQLKSSDDPVWSEYDEDKVMLGFPDADSAVKAYLAQYDDPRFLGSFSHMKLEDFSRSLSKSDGGPITCRMDADDGKKVKRLIDQAKGLMKEKSGASGKVGKLSEKFARQVISYQGAQLNKQYQAQFGVDLKLTDKKLPARIKKFAADNVALIQKMQTNVHDQVEKLVIEAVVEGELHDEVAEKIEKRFQVSESHAKLIARDQIGKLYGQINADRQKELGVKKFIWRTVADERVRDDHEEREKASDPAMGGTPYSYDDPPNGELPGEPIQCRCWAEPVFSSIGEDDDDE